MRPAHLGERDRLTTDRIGAGGEAQDRARTAWTSEEVHLTSTHFAAVLCALAHGPMTVVEIVAQTGVPANFVEEAVRVLALTGDVAGAGDHYTARTERPAPRRESVDPL
jgi:hypothetical protein